MFEGLRRRFLGARHKKDVEAKTAIIEKQASQNMKDTSKASGIQFPPYPTKRAAYFDMVEYFCTGHDDTAVDVIAYDSNNNIISKETFSWGNGCDEVTSEGIWKKANVYAERLIQEGAELRYKKSI